MINSTNERVAHRRRTARRVTLAGLLTTVALTAGAGIAAAADAPTAVETGYAVVVDEASRPTTAGGQCPDQTDSTDGAL